MVFDSIRSWAKRAAARTPSKESVQQVPVDWFARTALPEAISTDLFVGDDVIVRLVEVTPETDRLVVTWHSASIDDDGPRKSGFDMPGFAESFLTKHRVNAVHVIVSSSHWYQTAEMPASLAAILSVATRYARVVTYGSSMGAYASIKFGPAIGAAAAIAVSPQFSIDPRKAPFEKRFLKHFKAERWTSDEFDGAHHLVENYVFYDRFDDDGIHANLLAENVGGIIRVKVPFAAHPAGMMLNEIGLLGPAALEIIGGYFDVVRFGQTRARGRKSSKKFLTQLHVKALSRRDSTRALVTGKELHRRGWMAGDRKLEYATRLREAGRTEDADAISAELGSLTDSDTGRLRSLADGYMRAKIYPNAIAAFERILVLEPDNGPAAERLLIAQNRLKRQLKASSGS